MLSISPRRLGRRTLAIGAVGLVAATSAGAVAIYSTPGSPGGPPTPPSSGNGTSATDSGVESLGNALAGNSAAQLLNLESVTLSAPFATAGTIYSRVGVPGYGELAEGFTGRANGGTKPVTISFSAKGRAYLAAHVGQAVTLTLKYAFQPNITGPTRYSTATVTLPAG